jgi:hypothetical protein
MTSILFARITPGYTCDLHSTSQIETKHGISLRDGTSEAGLAKHCSLISQVREGHKTKRQSNKQHQS